MTIVLIEETMPFDGTNYEGRIEALEKTDKVIDLLSDEARWCKRALRTRDGRRCIVAATMAADPMAQLKTPGPARGRAGHRPQAAD